MISLIVSSVQNLDLCLYYLFDMSARDIVWRIYRRNQCSHSVLWFLCPRLDRLWRKPIRTDVDRRNRLWYWRQTSWWTWFLWIELKEVMRSLKRKLIESWNTWTYSTRNPRPLPLASDWKLIWTSRGSLTGNVSVTYEEKTVRDMYWTSVYLLSLVLESLPQILSESIIRASLSHSPEGDDSISISLM